jgi:hypothetical protein
MASVRDSVVLRAAAVAALLTLIAFALLVSPLNERANAQETVRLASDTTVRLASGTSVSLATPSFLAQGKRYAFTWAGGGPPQTHTLKRVHANGWVEVEVAEENIDPNLLTPGQLPTRWLNAGLALSIQEMRPIP